MRDVTFAVEPGQFCAVVGPTGCGKSTTLSMVSGLDRPSQGTVTFSGVETSVSTWSNTSIKCTVPVGALTGAVVVTNQVGNSAGKTFTVQP